MNILLTNDDGIEAEGLGRLAASLNEEGYDVYIAAPDSQRSGASSSVTVSQEIVIEREQVDGAVAAIRVTGSPVDCVKAGLMYFQNMGVKMDFCISGDAIGWEIGCRIQQENGADHWNDLFHSRWCVFRIS